MNKTVNIENKTAAIIGQYSLRSVKTDTKHNSSAKITPAHAKMSKIILHQIYDKNTI